MNNRISKLIYRNYGARDQFKIYNRLGIKLLLNYGNHIDRGLILKKSFEPEQIDEFRSTIHARQIDLVLDVGANIGIYSLIAATIPSVKEIISFEPDPRNHCNFRANLLLNRFHNKVKAIEKGLSERNEFVRFLQERGRSTGHSRIYETAPDSTRPERFDQIEIEVIKFDDFFQFNDRKAFVKIDVEGHELSALRGMQRFFRSNECTLQAEVFESNHAAFKSLMTEFGMRHKKDFGDDRIYSNM